MIIKFSRPISRAAPFDKPDAPDLHSEFECKRDLWSEADVQALRVAILINTIRALANPRVGTKTRSDLLDWIASEDIAPFSFRLCCLAEGLDPNALRDMLATRFRQDRQTA